MELIHITAEYSNAVLVAILPYISDFAARFELGITQPVTTNHVQRFRPDARKGFGGGLVSLTNGYEFGFGHGHMNVFRCPRSYHSLQDPDRIPEFVGELKMSKRQAVAFAREKLRRLGYTEQQLPLKQSPKVHPPPKFKGKRVPFYDIQWPKDLAGNFYARVEVDAQNRAVTLMTLAGTNLYRAPPDFGVEPELEADFIRRTKKQFPPANKTIAPAYRRELPTNSSGLPPARTP
jgi:hypothetical protein